MNAIWLPPGLGIGATVVDCHNETCSIVSVSSVSQFGYSYRGIVTTIIA